MDHVQNPNPSSGDFIVDDCFADDDLLTTPEEFDNSASQVQKIQAQKSFLERDNFESEFGATSEDPFSESFVDVAGSEIIDVFGEGDLVGRPVVIVYAHRFPSNKSFDHDKFLRYVQHTLDKIVDLDYTIIYFHYGLRSNNKPPLKWLIRAYQLLDRRYKKNLKSFFVVHPTKFIRVIWRIFQPFISLKFEQKMHYVNSLMELNGLIPIRQINLPQPIIDYDRSIKPDNLQSNDLVSNQITSSSPPRPSQQFNVPSLKFILDHNPNSDIPPIAAELIDFIREHGLDVEGIFRRSANIQTIKLLQSRINMGEKIDFINDPGFNGDVQNSVICASVLLKTFLRSLGEPLITNRLYPELTLLNAVNKSNRLEAIRELLQKLPSENYLLMKKILHLLADVAKHSEKNLMNANNLSVVFGPNLTWPTDHQVPMSELNTLNAFCYTLILHFEVIFAD